MSSTKYIALIDCDSFFCSCERKLNPELNNKPLSVVSSERGCVIARSREAKAIGIKMGDPLFKAVEEHPNCVYMVANHFNYLQISKQIMTILRSLSPNVEVYSIDEAFVDVTGLVKLYNKNYFTLAKMIQELIWNEVSKITYCFIIGVSPLINHISALHSGRDLAVKSEKSNYY